MTAIEVNGVKISEEALAEMKRWQDAGCVEYCFPTCVGGWMDELKDYLIVIYDQIQDDKQGEVMNYLVYLQLIKETMKILTP